MAKKHDERLIDWERFSFNRKVDGVAGKWRNGARIDTCADNSNGRFLHEDKWWCVV